MCICICCSVNLHVSWVKTNCTYSDKVRLPSSTCCAVCLIYHWADEMRAVRGGVHLHCCMQRMHSCWWTVQTVLNLTCWHSESLIQTPGSWAADIQQNISFPSLIVTCFVKLQEKTSVSVVSPEENWNICHRTVLHVWTYFFVCRHKRCDQLSSQSLKATSHTHWMLLILIFDDIWRWVH